MPKLPQHIEDRFDDKFGAVSYTPIHAKPAIKSLIATILDEERERVIKKLQVHHYPSDQDMAVIADIINLIKEDK